MLKPTRTSSCINNRNKLLLLLSHAQTLHAALMDGCQVKQHFNILLLSAPRLLFWRSAGVCWLTIYSPNTKRRESKWMLVSIHNFFFCIYMLTIYIHIYWHYDRARRPAPGILVVGLSRITPMNSEHWVVVDNADTLYIFGQRIHTPEVVGLWASSLACVWLYTIACVFCGGVRLWISHELWLHKYYIGWALKYANHK